jgi:predicted DNA-binding protein with PD1-like motif
MKYTQGNIGRIFVLKFNDDDILLDELSRFAKKERLRAAAMVFIGALKKGEF